MKIKLDSSPCDAPCCMKIILDTSAEDPVALALRFDWNPETVGFEYNDCLHRIESDGNCRCGCPKSLFKECAEQFLRELPEEETSLMIQADWDYPGIARTFGWNMRTVQLWRRNSDDHDRFRWDGLTPVYGCNGCRHAFYLHELEHDHDFSVCPICHEDVQRIYFKPCDHSSTDGTVDCKCGVTASQFIQAAGEWLRDNDGAEAEDPGYFQG